MRNTLVILNYQREIPPFMQNLIHFADDIFERVIYITPNLVNDNRDACNSQKLIVEEVSRARWIRAFVGAPFRCLSRAAISQCRKASINKKSVKKVLKQIAKHDICSQTLYGKVVAQVLQKEIDPSDTVVLSTWFSTEAYAAAKLKHKFPIFKTVSYAHSFEISLSKNSLMAYDMNEFKHTFCDSIVFISERMRDTYYSEISKVYSAISKKNSKVLYLGSQKLFPDYAASNGDENKVYLLSCSGATPVKRIHKIIEALAQWEMNVEITWTHLGGGPLLDDLKNQAKLVLTEKSNVSYEFLGSMSNRQVQEYYCMHPVDLFINVSDDEGLPVSIMESMSYGVPVIATDVGGTSEIVRENTGFLLQKDFKSEDFLAHIKRYLQMTNREKDELKQACLSLWKSEFDSDVNSKSFLNSLREEII